MMTTPRSTPPTALQLIRDQRAATVSRLEPDPRLVYWPWGFAWLVGFGLFFLRFSPDGRVLVRLPDWLPLTVLFVLLVAAAVVPAVAGARALRPGDRGFGAARRWYGWPGRSGSVSVYAGLGRVTEHLPHDQAGPALVGRRRSG